MSKYSKQSNITAGTSEIRQPVVAREGTRGRPGLNSGAWGFPARVHCRPLPCPPIQQQLEYHTQPSRRQGAAERRGLSQQ